VMMMGAGAYMVVADEQGRVLRFDATGNHVEAHVDGEVTAGTIDPTTGEVWLVVAGAAWHWSGASAPTLLALPAPVAMVTWTPVGLVSESAGVVYRADVTPPRVLATNLYQYHVNGSLMPTVTPQHLVTVHDLPTGLAFELPVSAGGIPDMLQRGRRVAYLVNDDRTDGRMPYFVWDLTVPTDAKALRAWLATVSNAISVQSSEAVSWPSY
jgi:hypothetical protein